MIDTIPNAHPVEGARYVYVFNRPHLNEDFPNGPVYVESKQHYRKLCKEQGVEARCLM
jgi:hypothetical protein